MTLWSSYLSFNTQNSTRHASSPDTLKVTSLRSCVHDLRLQLQQLTDVPQRIPAQSVAHHLDRLALRALIDRMHFFIRHSERPRTKLFEGVRQSSEDKVASQLVAVLAVEVVAGLCVSQSGSGDFEKGFAAFLAEVVVDLQKCWDLEEKVYLASKMARLI